jgi:hypothetical protein
MRGVQLVELEGLDEVVVGAGVEPGDLVAGPSRAVSTMHRRRVLAGRSARSTSRPRAG